MLRRFSRTALLLTLFAAAAPVADISGAWDFNVETSQGSGDPSFVFKQDGEKLTGTYTGLLGKADLTGTVKGDQVDFTFEAPNVDGKVHYKETLEGATRMKGECEYGDLGKGTFTATKNRAGPKAPRSSALKVVL